MMLSCLMEKQTVHRKMKHYGHNLKRTKINYIFDSMKESPPPKQYFHPKFKRQLHQIEVLKLIHAYKRQIKFVEIEDIFKKNVDKYMQSEHELLQDPKYHNKYVVIHEGEIVDFGDDKKKLLADAYRKFGYVSLIIHKIGTKRIIHHYTPFRR